jgi:hypothetical protein
MADEPRPSVDELRQLLRGIEAKSKVVFPRRPAVSLESVVPGRVVENPHGTLYLVEDDTAKLLAPGDDFAAVTDLFFKRGSVNRDLLAHIDERLADLAGLSPETILFLDIETAGFHGSCLFLIGLLVYTGGEFRVTQLFARNYAEEAAVIDHLREHYGRARMIVTFNGRAFDLPFIADRAVVHRVPLERPALDVDLLHVARRLWKGTLPDCRLGTLEQCICGRRRTGDLPSHLIPQAYHDFVESGDAALMVEVIRHNAYDLVTMAHLLAKMANG